mmetsp:Transcript_5957/g.16683  ORF Transcript_5957/g.16683 Transcript_5957/m.16683 type:complete len:146 (+) Transcript_5957:1155-1592(+)
MTGAALTRYISSSSLCIDNSILLSISRVLSGTHRSLDDLLKMPISNFGCAHSLASIGAPQLPWHLPGSIPISSHCPIFSCLTINCPLALPVSPSPSLQVLLCLSDSIASTVFHYIFSTSTCVSHTDSLCCVLDMLGMTRSGEGVG